jgi:predicted ATPase
MSQSIIVESNDTEISNGFSSNLPSRNKWIFKRNDIFGENTVRNLFLYGPSGFGKSTSAIEFCYEIKNKEQ